MKYSNIICHYSEITLKGKNRPFFEKKLQENIKKSLNRAGVDFLAVERLPGFILVRLPKRINYKNAAASLESVFGVANFSFALESEKEIEKIEKTALEILKEKNFETFKIITKRADKNYPLKSIEVSRRVGAFIVSKLGKKVDLHNPEAVVFIKILPKQTFIYDQKIKGPGGLPVSSSGRAVVLLSSGIDSPVASFLTMKRGVKLIFIHFHSYPYITKDSINNVKELVKILNKFQFESKIYFVPFAETQKQIVFAVPESLRVIVYRRFMMRIAQKIAEKERASAIVTGESIAQVASQTLENIKTIEESVSYPIFRPLIGFDKEEIINLAKKIGTYEISARPCEDACTLFMPPQPSTRADIQEVKKAENSLPIKEMVKKVIKESEQELLRDSRGIQ